MNKILDSLKKFGWIVTNYNWAAGYLVLIGIIGKPLGNENIDDADYGIIYFSRDYIGGDWNFNNWSVKFVNCTCLCNIEISSIERLITYLNNSENEYPDDDHMSDELISEHIKIDNKIREKENK